MKELGGSIIKALKVLLLGMTVDGINLDGVQREVKARMS